MERSRYSRFCFSTVTVLLALAAVCGNARSQQRILDDFESLQGWRAIPSDGAVMHLTSGQGKTGNAMVIDFDLTKVRGYVIAQKDFDLDLPSDYQFTFDMRADAPVNNFEFKLFDDKQNVYWIKKLNITYPGTWTHMRVTKHQISFAWGPSKAEEIRTVQKIEFVVSVGTGGKGKVFIDNLRFEPIDDNAIASAEAELLSPRTGASIDRQGTIVKDWRSPSHCDSIVVDFHASKEVGGLVLDWEGGEYATAYAVQMSDDGKDWFEGYTVTKGNGGRDYVPLPEGRARYLKLLCTRSAGSGYQLKAMAIKPAGFSSSTNDFFAAVAADAPAGRFPKYFSNRQSYWTVMGVNGDDKEALMNEQGEIEVDKLQYMLEPFLYVDGKLLTWDDMNIFVTLADGYMPIPTVVLDYKNLWRVTVTGCAAGVPGNSLLGIRYTVETKVPNSHAKLFVAFRPFQVDPPWQRLNAEGGVARIDSIVYKDGFVNVNGMRIVPMTRPDGFGAAEFDQGDITEYLARGVLPPAAEVHDHFGYASGALMYAIDVQTEGVAQIQIAVPFHGWKKVLAPNMDNAGSSTYYDMMSASAKVKWKNELGQFSLSLPPAAKDVEKTIKSNLGYILVNRDGPGIQPGSRSYERSWIRDGSLTSTALLRCGITSEVKEFLDWYATGQFPNGKVPCVMDKQGPDAVPENDSHGELIYAILQYFRFTRDTTWLRGKWEAVQNAVHYIQTLRAERKTETYLHGTPEQRACYGLVPESISHEGYSDAPRHSYWDDFFVLRGLKDATTIAGILGDSEKEKAYAAERDDFRKDLYASMRQAMKNKNISYIPGCVELGDFDATSTTIGITPCGELGNIPEPQLHNTFDKYYAFFTDRKANKSYCNYTPYETRVIGSFVRLGEKKRAQEALEFFMNDRRPAAWNEWAEVVWSDPSTPKFIGDMPHTWVGSDFIRSVLDMFVYDREKDDAHVLCAGVPDAWILDSTGVSVAGLRTYYGTVGYSVKSRDKKVSVALAGSFAAKEHKLVLAYPLEKKPLKIVINGKNAPTSSLREVRVPSLPATIEFEY